MEKNFTSRTSIESLVNFIEGTANESVSHEIEQWINGSEENCVFFERFRQVWTNQEDLASLLADKRAEDWEKVSRVVNQNSGHEPDTKAKHFNWRWLQRIAAVFILIVFTTVAYFMGNKQEPLPFTEHASMYHEIVVPIGEKSELKLADGTIIWINAGSKVRFPNRFSGISRDIWLDGEAYFEVARDKEKPFLVHTSDLDVKVYGTKFNLKAYKEEDIIEATLIEGLVSLETRNILNNKKEEIFLKPNHKAIYLKKKSKTIENEIVRAVSEPLKPRKIIISNPIKAETSMSWRDGKLEFFEEPFENIAVKLERRYGIKKEKYSGVLKNISIEQALKAIQMTNDFDFRIEDNKVIITGNESKKNRKE